MQFLDFNKLIPVFSTFREIKTVAEKQSNKNAVGQVEMKLFHIYIYSRLSIPRLNSCILGFIFKYSRYERNVVKKKVYFGNILYILNPKNSIHSNLRDRMIFFTT